MLNAPGIRASIWLFLGLVDLPIVRRVQPTLAMAGLVDALLLSASVCLYLLARFILRERKPVVLALEILAGAFALGATAALLIRMLYRMLYPDVVPFGMAMNILMDTAWIGFNALVVFLLFRVFQSTREPLRK